MKKIVSLTVFLFAISFILTGCTGTSIENSDGTITLRMAHGISGSSPSGQAVNEIAGIVDEVSDGNIQLEVYDSGVLGSERDTVEMIQAGVLDIAKVGASTLDAFEPLYGVFSLPYMFDSEEDLYSAMTNSDAIEILNNATRDKGFIMIGWYTSGYRNFYTKDVKVETPEDLKNLKIRVMESATSKELVEMMGASPVPMASSETYTAMQQGVIDGAENNELALTSNRHMDVAKYYSYTQHQLVPDIFIMSTKTADKLTDEQLYQIEEAIWQSNLAYRELNKQMIDEAITESKEAGVEFIEVDKEPFEAKVEPMQDEFAEKGPEYAELIDTIKGAAGKEANYESPKIK